MTQHTYSIRQSADYVTQSSIFEVWGRTAATGYEWLIAEFNTRAEAVALIASWSEVGE
jgi:hypothetical protein